jgi:predicted small lipoprotein YifL
MRCICVLLSVAALLTACGQKGDLYMPAAEREAVATVPANATLPAATESDDDETREPAPPPQ